jgi:hypothetical protein
MKSIYTILSLVLVVVITPTFFSFTKPHYFPTAAPTGYTGAPPVGGTSGAYCTSCHGDFPINSGGGNVATLGLPTSVTLGTSYNFSTVITHGIADREKFGFAIKAVDATNTEVGTFSSTNPNAGPIGSEIGHLNAPFVLSTDSYTYGNLTWTAPTVAPAYPVTFYIVGNAGNNGLGTAGDYIYSSTVVANAAVVPVTLSNFSAKQLGNADVTIQWRTEQEINTGKFDIEKSSDGQVFSILTTYKAQGNSNTAKNYSIVDKNPNTKGEFIYYRLKMIDKDGSFKYSEIVQVSLTTKEITIKNVATIHNALNNSFEVNILSPNTQPININWVNSNGQLLTRETKTLIKGANNFILRNNKIAKGEVVYLQFTSGGLNKTYTLVN